MSALEEHRILVENLRAQLAKEESFNRELRVQLKTADRKQKQPLDVAKHAEDGISWSAWKRHPTCPFCGLEDAGKVAGFNRPTEAHMLNCRGRTLMSLPLVQTETGKKLPNGKPELVKIPRAGTFRGECLQRQLTYPVRQMLKFIPKDRLTGIPLVGEDDAIWICKYKWRTEEGVVDWVWSGEAWVEWWVWNSKPRRARGAAVYTEQEERWLKGFVQSFRHKKDETRKKG